MRILLLILACAPVFLSGCTKPILYPRSNEDIEENRRRMKYESYSIVNEDGSREKGRRRFIGIVGALPRYDYDGVIESWYASGQKQSELPTKDGNSEGVARNWYSDGKLKAEVAWHKGVHHGAFTLYYDSGVRSVYGSYTNAALIEAHYFSKDSQEITAGEWEAIPGNRRLPTDRPSTNIR